MAEVLTIRGIDQATRRLEVLTRTAPEHALRGCLAGAHFLLSSMKENYLSGQRLRVRTGKLRSNWRVRPLGGLEGSTAARAGSTSTVGAVVSTNTRYAPVHEYGFTGVVSVREHMRRRLPKVKQETPRSKTAKLRVRAEARRRAQAMKDPGLRTYRNSPVLRRTKLLERRARGFQGPVSANLTMGMGRALGLRRARTGETVFGVRQHTRFVRVRAKWYLRDTLRLQGDKALEIVRLTIQKAVESRG